jgi:phage-related minor tail protein
MAEARELQILLNAKDNASKTLQGMGKSFLNWKTVAIGAVTAVAGLMVKAGLDIEKAQSEIVKGTGASGKELEEMVAIARRVNRNVPQDLNDVAKVVADINTRLNLTGKELDDTSKAFLDFARISGLDTATAVRNITRLMGDWGIEASETNNLLDQLTKASQMSGASIDNLSNIAVNYGVQLRALGFSQIEAIALLSKFEKEGVATEKIFTGLSMALGRLAQAGVDDTAEAFKLLTGELEATGSTGEAVRQAIEILGTRAGPDFALAVLEGRFAIDEYVEALENADGALTETAESSKTTGEKIKELRQTVMDIVAPSGEMAGGFNEIIDSTKAWIEENEELISSIVNGIMVVMKSLMWLIARTVEGFGMFADQLGLIMYSIYKFFDDAIILIKDVWNGIPDYFKGIWEDITGVFQSAIDWIMRQINRLLSAVNRAKSAASSIGGGIGGAVSGAIGTVGRVFGVQDAIISPKGDIITTHPDDYIVATKTPQSLGGGGMVINVYGDVSGQDLIDKISEGIMGNLRNNTQLAV